MKSIIVGTAGHIDHGKTALAAALTGVDTDRLAEEKRRGISIELGFAPLELGGGVRAGLVDVPGHERFVKTMVAGATGIDLVMLVVAADESVKPQTREHFDICRLLGLRTGVVVITKSDLVDGELMELVEMEVEEFVAGSFLEGAPVVGVSARTGEGIEELRGVLRELAGRVAERASRQSMRLPVDRSFAMKGFGSVVTGTLTAGTIAVEQEVELHPAARKLRVRGVQVHGKAAKRAEAGQRTAVNLAGIEHSDIARGMMLTEPGVLRGVTVLDCKFTLLAGEKALGQRTPVHFHAGTAETVATARNLGEGFARIRLREPLVVLPGDRFIVRRISPVVTIGGGEVVEIAPPRRSRVVRMAGLDVTQRAETMVRESAHGMSRGELYWRLGEEAKVGVAAGEYLVDAAWLTEKGGELERALGEFHKQHPLLAGMKKEDARARVMGSAPGEVFAALLERTKKVVAQGELLRLAAHRVHMQQDEREAKEKIEGAFLQGGLAVPGQRDVLAGSGVDGTRAAILLATLLKEKKLVRVSAELVFHATALDGLRELLAGKKGERFAVGEFKDWTGVSRKYAIPLLEFLDRERVTRRDGDERVVV